MIGDDALAAAWRAARPPVAGVHLDSAACARQSLAAIDAAARHARRESEVGGYLAERAAAPALAAGRAAIATLTGLAAADVVFTTGSGHALDLLATGWPERGTVACVPGEFGPNLAILAAAGFTVRPLPVDGLGRVRPEELAADLDADRPALVHLTVIGSHRGIVQPAAQIARICAAAAVPLVLDAAQGLGQVDCAVGADAVYSSSRKWLAGPRGVGFLAVRPETAARLRPRLPATAAAEANIAARLGYAVALGEYLAAGPVRMRAALAAVGAASRRRLAGLAGWTVVEPVDEPCAIATLIPPDGVDPVAVRDRLLAEHRIVCTAAETARAPFELTRPVLRISPHVEVTGEELDALAEALSG